MFEGIMELFGYVKEKRRETDNSDHVVINGIRRRIYESPAENDHDFKYVPIYVRERYQAFESMMSQVDNMDMTRVAPLFPLLREQITAAREDANLVEPLHIQFVGKPRQCKTQVALRILDIFEKYGYLCVSRNSQDGFFDDLQKVITASRERKVHGEYVLHPTIHGDNERREACKLDVIFLDELYSKKREAADIATILNGITPMAWRPHMADPKNKGASHKPFIWITTANHEVTDHEYSVTALLKRVHLRFVVEGGKFYHQDCYQVLEPEGDFLGGFETCKGRFGHFRRRETSVSVSRSIDPVTGENRESVTNTQSSRTTRDVVDSSILTTFLCAHSRMILYEDLVAQIVIATTSKLQMSVLARDNFRAKIDAACRQD
jgi:hypothetical protein